MYGGAPYAEVQSGYVHRHVDFETQRQAYPMTLRYSLDLRYMFGTINHQCDMGSGCGSMGYGCNVVFVPGRIANEQVIEALGSQVGCFPGGVAHDALENGIRG